MSAEFEEGGGFIGRPECDEPWIRRMGEIGDTIPRIRSSKSRRGEMSVVRPDKGTCRCIKICKEGSQGGYDEDMVKGKEGKGYRGWGSRECMQFDGRAHFRSDWSDRCRMRWWRWSMY